MTHEQSNKSGNCSVEGHYLTDYTRFKEKCDGRTLAQVVQSQLSEWFAKRSPGTWHGESHI
jgi:hypothetical protein